MSSGAHPIFTVGHSNHSGEAFVELLRRHGVEEAVDVRSSPYSRNPYTAHFNREALASLLEEHGIRYVFLGDELGGRPADSACYDASGRVRYEEVARSDGFFSGVCSLLRDAESRRVAVVCSEKEPLDCHRTLLIAHALTSEAYGVDGGRVRHILADGRVETHEATMRRLVESAPAKRGQARQFGLFDAPSGRDAMGDVVERAVRLQAARVGYRRGGWPGEGAAGEDE